MSGLAMSYLSVILFFLFKYTAAPVLSSQMGLIVRACVHECVRRCVNVQN